MVSVDAIWMIVDRLNKSAHFIPISESISTEKLVDIYIQEVMARHGVPVSIILDRDILARHITPRQMPE